MSNKGMHSDPESLAAFSGDARRSVPMDKKKFDAYRFLFSRAMLDIKWKTQGMLRGLSIYPIFLFRQIRLIKDIAEFAYIFHNLPIFIEQDMTNFNEDRFCKDIDQFSETHGDYWPNYRILFEKHLNGEDVNIYDFK